VQFAIGSLPTSTSAIQLASSEWPRRSKLQRLARVSVLSLRCTLTIARTLPI
jgi:hypothetical protein